MHCRQWVIGNSKCARGPSDSVPNESRKRQGLGFSSGRINLCNGISLIHGTYDSNFMLKETEGRTL